MSLVSDIKLISRLNRLKKSPNGQRPYGPSLCPRQEKHLKKICHILSEKMIFVNPHSPSIAHLAALDVAIDGSLRDPNISEHPHSSLLKKNSNFAKIFGQQNWKEIQCRHITQKKWHNFDTAMRS